MILVIGGQAAGKRTYVRNHYGYTDQNMADAVINEMPVLYNLQDMVARAPEEADRLKDALLRKEVVIYTEVGSGIVPLDANERAMREAAGRLVNQLARHAECVVRVICGLPQVLKG